MKYLIRNKYWDIVEDYNIDKILYLLIDRPDEIINERICWNNCKNILHRNYDLPSFVETYSSYRLFWDYDGKLHRENKKPAVIQTDGEKIFFIHDKRKDFL